MSRWIEAGPHTLADRAEALAVSLLAGLSSVVVAVYLCDRLGFAFTPHPMLAVAASAAIATIAWLRAGAVWGSGEAATFVGVLATAFGWLMWMARPDFLPLGADRTSPTTSS